MPSLQQFWREGTHTHTHNPAMNSGAPVTLERSSKRPMSSYHDLCKIFIGSFLSNLSGWSDAFYVLLLLSDQSASTSLSLWPSTVLQQVKSTINLSSDTVIFPFGVRHMISSFKMFVPISFHSMPIFIYPILFYSIFFIIHTWVMYIMYFLFCFLTACHWLQQ